jgi:hypothetical protein
VILLYNQITAIPLLQVIQIFTSKTCEGKINFLKTEKAVRVGYELRQRMKKWSTKEPAKLIVNGLRVNIQNIFTREKQAVFRQSKACFSLRATSRLLFCAD